LEKNQEALPLDGVRVIDISRVLAGPYCGQLMADMGADVIKVESPQGDENRRWSPLLPSGESCNFASVNRGKRGLTLNLTHPRGREVFHQLLASADVLLHNFLPSTAAKLGVDIVQLEAQYPDLVICSLTAFGAEGPLRDRPGYDSVLQAFAGLMAITGEPDGAPVRAGSSIIDMATGLVAFGGIMTALYSRLAGKKRRRVSVSLFETAVAMLGYHGTAWLEASVLPHREGSGIWHLVPYQAFMCSDQYLFVAALNDATWRRLCDALELADLRDDPTLATNEQRVHRRDHVVGRISQLLRTRPANHWQPLLERAHVPASPLHTLDQVFEHEQTLANHMLVTVSRGDGSTMRQIGIPFKVGELTGASIAPPTLGQHTDEILAELRHDAASVAALKQDGAV